MSTIRRALTIVLALLGAAGFAISVEGGRWWVIRSVDTDVGIGPISTGRCFGGECTFTSLTWTGGSALWQRAGSATYAAGLCAAVVLLALAGSLAAKRAGRLVAAVVGVSVVTGLVAAGVFVSKSPDLHGASLGRGALAFAIAIGCAIVAVALTLTARRTEP